MMAGVAAAEPSVLVFGDSLSAAYGMAVDDGWVAGLEQRLRTAGYPHRVINASVSGETSGGGLARLPAALARHRPQVTIVELGANDGLRGQPLAALEQNLTRIVNELSAHGSRVLLVAMRLPPNYGPAYVREFADVYRRVADVTGATLSAFLLDGVAGNPELLLDDALHPNAAAQPRLLDNVWPALEPLLQ
jgi:acyl-CoA thioesterase-1